MNRVLVVGSSNIDTTLYVENLPNEGETISAISKVVSLGGKGLNQAIALKRALADVTFLTPLGSDLNGELVKKQLNDENLNAFIIVKENANTGSAFINVSKSGNNSIVIDGGSNSLLNVNDLKSYKDSFKDFDYLLLQNEINQEVNEYLINTFHSLNKKVALNNSPIRVINKELLSKIDYLFINEIELDSIYTEINSENNSLDYKTKAKSLLESGIKNIVLTLGKDGAIFISKNIEVSVPSIKVNAIDSVGAGDTFTGYFLSMLSKEKSIKDALTYASVAAGLSVTKKGAIPSIPSFIEVEKYVISK